MNHEDDVEEFGDVDLSFIVICSLLALAIIGFCVLAAYSAANAI